MKTDRELLAALGDNFLLWHSVEGRFYTLRKPPRIGTGQIIEYTNRAEGRRAVLSRAVEWQDGMKYQARDRSSGRVWQYSDEPVNVDGNWIGTDGVIVEVKSDLAPDFYGLIKLI